MPRQAATIVEKNFIKGLQTEYTGLNFPVNAATETFNCIYGMFGEVTRRLAFEYETNYTKTSINRASKALSTYKWNNAGGDGSTQVFVEQVGGTLHFYGSSSALITAPLSDQKLASTVDLTAFVASGGSFTASKECTYADGNGYLFVYHPDMTPIYCTYVAGTITGNAIDVRIRDFTGVLDSLEDSFRSTSLTDAHTYNLYNQGWYAGSGWTATSTTNNNPLTGTKTWTIQTGIVGIANGDLVTITGTSGAYHWSETGIVVAPGYTSGTGVIVINVTSSAGGAFDTSASWTFQSNTAGFISTFHTAASVYPSNVDVWWRFKNASDVFDPATTLPTVSQFAGPAPKGRFILSAFNQNRTATSSVSNITTVSTTVRPRIGAWFQGRVWYTGVDASFAETGTAQATSWSETIYFSQIVEKPEQFGRAYQLNDPTSEEAFDPLPSDGGTVRIQGCGPIYKLFAIQNGLIVFAGNGIWFITGNQGIGFSATDYSVTKISGIESCSSTSFINVQGYPMFWNEEGIYYLTPAPQGQGFEVNNLALGSILSFYEDIPFQSKKFARGDYNPIDYIVQWVYRSTNESNTTNRYECDRVLCFNIHTKAFYPYSVTGNPKIHDVKYIQSPGGSTAPSPVFKYLISSFEVDHGVDTYFFLFAEENSTTYLDWFAYDTTGTDYSSYVFTGYELTGEATKFFQQNYIFVYSRADATSKYEVQGVWDYATSSDTGRWSQVQRFTIDIDDYSYLVRKIKIRGKGRAGQLKFSSVTGYPFFLIGWGKFETTNGGI